MTKSLREELEEYRRTHPPVKMAKTCISCGRKIPYGSRCKQHGASGWDKYAYQHPERAGAYDFSWQVRRKRQLAEHPDCQLRFPGCRGRAWEVDHVTAIANGGDFNGPIQSVCTPCHRKKTARDSAESKRRAAERRRQP